MSFIWLYKLPLTFDFRSRPQEAVECLFSNCLIKKRRNHEICPMERNRNSGILEIFANEMWNPWLWNPEYSSGNWNLESRCLADKEPGIHSWNLDSRMQDSEPIKEKIANNSTQSVGRLVPFVDDIVVYLF